jgi:hypothetical protein
MERIQTDPKPTDDKPGMQPYESVVAEAIKATKQAELLKDSAIKKLLALREQIDADLKTLGYEPARQWDQNGMMQATVGRSGELELKRAAGPKPFREMDLASVARIILQEHGGGPMHGKEIEKLAKAGGYDKGGAHWQGYLAIALKRAGGIENIGMNRWRLNDQIAPIPIGRRIP